MYQIVLLVFLWFCVCGVWWHFSHISVFGSGYSCALCSACWILLLSVTASRYMDVVIAVLVFYHRQPGIFYHLSYSMTLNVVLLPESQMDSLPPYCRLMHDLWSTERCLYILNNFSLWCRCGHMVMYSYVTVAFISKYPTFVVKLRIPCRSWI